MDRTVIRLRTMLAVLLITTILGVPVTQDVTSSQIQPVSFPIIGQAPCIPVFVYLSGWAYALSTAGASRDLLIKEVSWVWYYLLSGLVPGVVC